MLSLPDVFGQLAFVENVPTEDLIDRLNFAASVYIFATFMLITGGKQHFGTPIQCMPGAETPGHWQNYYHDLCYIQDTYLLNSTKLSKSTRGYTVGDPPRITYYQWVPYMLLAHMALFLAPKVFWKIFSNELCAGRDLRTTITEANKLRTLYGKKKTDGLDELGNFILDGIDCNQEGKWLSNSLTSVGYTTMKWLCVLNAVLQFGAMSAFIGQDNHFWGFELLHNLTTSTTRNVDSGIFPLVTVCEVSLEKIGDPVNVTMQCVLMLNFINEKVYLILYFWLIFVGALSLLSAIHRTLVLFLPRLRLATARHFLPSKEKLFENVDPQPSPKKRRQWMEKFTHGILGADGVLLLYFVSIFAGMHIAKDLTLWLWNKTIVPHVVDDEELVYCNVPRSKAFELGPSKEKERERITAPLQPNTSNCPADDTLPPVE